MRQLSSLFLLLVLLLGLSGCGVVTVDEYASNQPTLTPETFFQGQLTAHGVIKDRGGKVIRYFNADIKAYWQDGIGTLEEDFLFDDGELDRRVWTLTPTGEGQYVGTAGDVVGEGKITVAGNSMFLDYVLQIPWDDGTLDLRIDDRMYLVNPTTLINESIMTKFGIRVGEILLVISKVAD
ncbi:MAG TPA: DUF3833 domain-containing protein [Haliea salexigens]|uniref:DUF3833 domain-containing protein n=1 Tax=Haliea salexigens TaxID=287487 RepID=A0A3C1KKI8_9GAMM|nr:MULTISPECIES: DUF3833 domain-containing protein [Haliea]MAD62657.1 DUF3833 domain-containing protein [Haliea sp.]HAN26736.1 DUF3833 domain-containing protein [Haliea salexigens]|tara:strand:- start:3647 stop:4186 length:540 start_codon:yes stop_codon:yes gene_type:complete